MRTTARLFVAASLTAALAFAAAPASGPYDPSADGLQELQAAAARAAGGNKRILAMVGGNW
ncbi:MAG: hypothetical protein H6Q02_2529 [Acidobacteria bacterium]|nr:hypothetical protein [Acidobacteriota bacterium]